MKTLELCNSFIQVKKDNYTNESPNMMSFPQPNVFCALKIGKIMFSFKPTQRYKTVACDTLRQIKHDVYADISVSD